MSANFFSNFPFVNYDLYENGSNTVLTNITQAVNVIPSNLPDDASIYTYYTIIDGDRPDTVSYNLYGTPQYYWTFFALNTFLRNGLNAAWSLSYKDFNKMIDDEYSPYSAITFYALSSADIDGYSRTDFSLTALDSKYLPYLRLKNSEGTTSKILKYDSLRQQLIVHSITNDFRDSFIASPSYTLSWDKSIPDTDNIIHDEWITFMFDVMLKENNPSRYRQFIDSLPTNITSSAILALKENYIFDTSYTPVSFTAPPSGLVSYPYNWSLYHNAACTYYDSNSNMTTVYNLLNSSNPTIAPTYKSFYDVEYEDNSAKSNIKIIRDDRIVDFANSYFTVLNS